MSLEQVSVEVSRVIQRTETLLRHNRRYLSDSEYADFGDRLRELTKELQASYSNGDVYESYLVRHELRKFKGRLERQKVTAQDMKLSG